MSNRPILLYFSNTILSLVLPIMSWWTLTLSIFQLGALDRGLRGVHELLCFAVLTNSAFLPFLTKQKEVGDDSIHDGLSFGKVCALHYGLCHG